MRDVYYSSRLVDLSHQSTPFWGQPSLSVPGASRRCRHAIVLGMDEPEQPDSASDPPPRRAGITDQRRRPFERQPCANPPTVDRAARQAVGHGTAELGIDPGVRAFEVLDSRPAG